MAVKKKMKKKRNPNSAILDYINALKVRIEDLEFDMKMVLDAAMVVSHAIQSELLKHEKQTAD